MSRLRTRFTDESESPGLLLWRVGNRWQAAIRDALAPYDLTHTQFVLLASLTWLRRERDEPVTQRELADYAMTDVMMTSQVVRTLESKGFIERRPHPGDSRARDLVVTAAGLDRVNAAIVAVEECDATFFAAAGPTFLGLLAGLQRLAGEPSA
ncbi:MarR family transcriptional regulator [Intrasporangium oryzae NRRL B-24470]|uniref:MarR family transcriptional regulator n=1 Tax=Intrasporangium oryzae NRRL B-24470 TaxID=1386089 RepID=W9GBI0_9MICO|nr:MarR family transcriptional regulator [Intrasporangium oryzae]EWT01224.1 MarR family transcriptional regulator [Intrasporangium oryzae NRRL B-24470]